MRSRRILIIDDDPGVRKTLSDILRTRDYEPVTAASGEEAAAMMCGEMSGCAVAVIDLRLGDMTGLEVMKKIKGVSPDTECILLTGHASKETAIEAVNLNAFGYLQKPFDMEQLLLTIQRAYDKWEAGHALRESEEKYRSLAATTDLMYIVDGECRFLFMNEGYRRRRGVALRDILGRTYGEFHSAEGTEKFTAKVEQVFETGESIHHEHRSGRDGKHFLRTLSPVKNQKGETTAVTVVSKDITERKEMEEALRESNEKYRSLTETAADVIFTLDTEGRITYLNPEFERVTGHTVAAFTGRPFVDALVSASVAPTVERLTKGPASKTTAVYEVELLHRDGGGIPVEMNVTSLFDGNGAPAGSIGIARDITERRQAMLEKKNLELQFQQAQRMEAIGTLAGGIAHDFNNLLMGIEGSVSLLMLKMDPGHPHYKRLKNIEQYVMDGAELTGHLLGFARGGKYEARPTDLNRLIRKTADMFARTKKEITLFETYQEDIWTVEADQGQIEQTLLNIYVNAWQAMPGGGDLYLQTENILIDEHYVQPYHIEPGRYVKISVTDTGVGMDEETTKKIFYPFFTTKERSSTKGTGLGLASAYGIVKNHKGFINVYSEQGVGTTFTIYLPASDTEAAEEKLLPREYLTGTETILLVDDEERITAVGKDILEALGYTALLARSGEEAVAIYRERGKEIDLVILDMIMPGMGGGEVYNILREINPGIRVLLSSGYSLSGQAQEILARGCDDFIQKPFNIEQLSRTIRKLLEKKPDSEKSFQGPEGGGSPIGRA